MKTCSIILAACAFTLLFVSCDSPRTPTTTTTVTEETVVPDPYLNPAVTQTTKTTTTSTTLP